MPGVWIMIPSYFQSSLFFGQSRPDIKGAKLGVTSNKRNGIPQECISLPWVIVSDIYARRRSSFPFSIQAVGSQWLGNYWAMLIKVQLKLSQWLSINNLARGRSQCLHKMFVHFPKESLFSWSKFLNNSVTWDWLLKPWSFRQIEFL